MARRKARIPQGKKIQPAVKTLQFTFASGGGEDGSTSRDDYIDLSQCASLVNRRFYRQGLNWAVAGFTIISPQGVAGACVFKKIPDTWVSSNSWEKGFRTWMKMNNEALEQTESVKPKFLDFKVFMDAGHHDAGVGNNLLPVGEDMLPATAGEWEYSKVYIPDTANPGTSDDRDIIWTGSNYPGVGASGSNAVSLIEGYAASRGLPDILDPNTPDDADSLSGIPQNWFGALSNEGTTQDAKVVEDMISENNLAPYPFENDGVHTDTQYPGGANQLSGVETHDWAGVSATTIANTTKVAGTNFPGGLIKITNDLYPAASGYNVLLVHLVPGHHRGYMAQPMQDV